MFFKQKFREMNKQRSAMTILHNVENTVWKLWKFTLTYFWQKIRESNGFTKEITK